ncbi:MAG: hypothetical protein QN209_12860 [Armatimonadota bacterium]|nr:hypothetical protein [Armatimonadota bacterium]
MHEEQQQGQRRRRRRRRHPPAARDVRTRLRAGILAFLSRHQETQVGTLLDALRQQFPGFDRAAETAALEVLHELASANLIMPAVDRDHLGWPWLRVTEHGRQVLRQGKPLPFDPDQYLAAAQPRLAAMPPLAVEVLQEAVTTYHRGYIRSSALLLGIASEILMGQLIDAFVAGRPEKERQRLQAAMADKSIYARYRIFREEFDRARDDLKIPDALSKDLEAIVDLVFNAVRLTRNEAGHPSGATLNPVLVATTLQAFLEYADRIARLSTYLTAPAPEKPAPPGRRRRRRTSAQPG